MGLPFPTDQLSCQPTFKWSEEPYGDPVIVSDVESGIPLTRKRVTKLLITLNCQYVGLTTAEKNILQGHYDSDCGREFAFRNPIENQDWLVRYQQKPRFDIIFTNSWNAEFQFFGKRDEKMRVSFSDIEDLAAGADITDRPVFVFPTKDVVLNEIGILTQGAPAGVDNSNTIVITIKNEDGQTLVTKSYDTASQPPTNNYASLGALSNVNLDAADHLLVSVTQGATANMPSFRLVFEFYIDS